MAMSSDDGDDNYWPGYVDALTTMTMVLTFILMVLGVVVFTLSQSVSRAYIDAIADAAGLPHPKSVEQSAAVISQVVTLLREKDREPSTGGQSARGEGVESTSSKVPASRAESVAEINPQGTSVPADQQRDGPAAVALAEPDPVNFARPTNGGVPQEIVRPSGERLTSASPEVARTETANRPIWDPKAEAGHLTRDSGEAPLALSGGDPVRSGQPGTGEVPAVQQLALATEKSGKAAVAGDPSPADKPTDSNVPATSARVDLKPVPNAPVLDKPGQPGSGDAAAAQQPTLATDAGGKAAVTGLNAPADKPSDVTQPAVSARVDLQPIPGAPVKDQPGQPGAGDAAAVQQPALVSDALGKAAVADTAAPADRPSDATQPAVSARVDLRPIPGAAALDKPGQPGAGDMAAVQQSGLVSDVAGKAAVAGATAPADKPIDATQPATSARVDLAPVSGVTPQDKPGQPGLGEIAAMQQSGLVTDKAGKAAVAGVEAPADRPSESTEPAVSARVDLLPIPGTAVMEKPGQPGSGDAAAQGRPSVTSERVGSAAVAGDKAPADVVNPPGPPATVAQLDLQPLPDQPVKPLPGQSGAADDKALDRPASGTSRSTPAPGDKSGTEKATPEQGPALAMLLPAPDAQQAPLSAGPREDERTTPGGVPLSVRDKPNPDPAQVIESAMAPVSRTVAHGAEVTTTAGAALTVRFKPRSLTLTSGERGQIRDFLQDLSDKGVRDIYLEAVAAVTQDGFSDERRAAYSRMMVIRNELLASKVAPQNIHMQIVDSLNAVEANVVKVKRP